MVLLSSQGALSGEDLQGGLRAGIPGWEERAEQGRKVCGVELASGALSWQGVEGAGTSVGSAGQALARASGPVPLPLWRRQEPL